MRQEIKTKIFIVTISLLFLNLLSSNSYAGRHGDFQFWNIESLSWKLNTAWKANIDEELRFINNSDGLYYDETNVGVEYLGLTSWLNLGLNYAQIYEKKKSEWKVENKPQIDVTLKHKFLNFNLADRNRFEYRMIESADNLWRYRNKITLDLNTNSKISPFIADEIFINLADGQFNTNRWYAGFNLNFSERLKISLYYLLLSSKSTVGWTNSDVAGLTLKFLF